MTTDGYREAGVDLDAADEALARIAPLARATHRREVLGDLGGFAGLFDLASSGYHDPLLVATTDGVGTKAELARLTDRLDTIGVDLVAMCVDDLVCVGAEPLMFLDYLAVGRLDPDRVERLVAGIAEGCKEAGCALIGGETAEHPGTLDDDAFDPVGFAVGAVERDRVLDGSTIRTGDALVGLASPNLRSNGFSLVRRVVFDMAARSLDEPAWPGSSATLGEELLSPSVVYSPAVLATLADHEVHGVVHITGGGLPGNLTRVLGGDLDAVVEASAWEVPRVFEEIRAMGGIELSEMERVFNMGIGMVLVVPPGGVDAVTTTLADHDCPATTIGEVVDGTGRVEIRR